MKYFPLIVLVVAALFQVHLFQEQAMATDFPIVGMQAPGFDLPDLSGQTHSLSQYLGRPLVVNFWTTWCGACTYEFPVLEEFNQKYADQAQLIAICAGTSQEEAVTTVKEKGVDFLVLYDDQQIISKAYQPPQAHAKRRVTAFPFSVFIDADGRVVYARIGTFTDIDKMVSLLEESGISLAPAAAPSDDVHPVDRGKKAKE